MIILAIDTSCDDTSVSVLKDGKILSNAMSSQIQFHKKWGGVVPSIAKRMHAEKIDTVLNKALKEAKVNIEDVDYFAVTYGPGLAIALEVGINKAKELSKQYHKPLVPINHMEGHIYSNFALNKNGKGYITDIEFPYMALLVSGNHSEIIIMKDHGIYEKLGETQDDAVGEAFDKVARMIGLGYPGGAIMSKMAENGDPSRFKFPIPMQHSKDLNFSYSGLKTAVSRVVNELGELSKQDIYDISASFQYAAITELCIKVEKAMSENKVNGLILGGGVSANVYLRKRLREICKGYNIPLFLPLNKKLCTDNGAMIATCAYWKIMSGQFEEIDIDALDRKPRLSL